MSPVMSNPAALPGAVPDQGPENRRGDSWPRQQRTPSGLELVSEVSDLAAGAGLPTFTLTPLAPPALALTALAAALLFIPALLGATLAAPFLLAWHWRRAHGRPSPAANPARFGDREAGCASATCGGSNPMTNRIRLVERPSRK